MTPRLLLGVVAKEPVYAPELRELTTIADSLICARCDGTMVLTPDAIGRLRKRCPTCDGVAKVRHHPDQVLVPVTLASLTAVALPPIEPGQLRCQVCARSVEGDRRFCDGCAKARNLSSWRRGYHCRTTRSKAAAPTSAGITRTYKQKPCVAPECGALFTPTGPRSLYCETHQVQAARGFAARGHR
jgi:hypothetical protein